MKHYAIVSLGTLFIGVLGIIFHLPLWLIFFAGLLFGSSSHYLLRG
jgi:hypothetical protein